MSKLTDLKNDLIALSEQLLVLLNGGEDSLDTNTGESVFTEPTRAAQAKAVQDLKMQYNWLGGMLGMLEAGIQSGYDVISTYEVDPEVSTELAMKREQIKRFQDLFIPALKIGADAITIEKV